MSCSWIILTKNLILIFPVIRFHLICPKDVVSLAMVVRLVCSSIHFGVTCAHVMFKLNALPQQSKPNDFWNLDDVKCFNHAVQRFACYSQELDFCVVKVRHSIVQNIIKPPKVDQHHFVQVEP